MLLLRYCRAAAAAARGAAKMRGARSARVTQARYACAMHTRQSDDAPSIADARYPDALMRYYSMPFDLDPFDVKSVRCHIGDISSRVLPLSPRRAVFHHAERQTRRRRIIVTYAIRHVFMPLHTAAIFHSRHRFARFLVFFHIIRLGQLKNMSGVLHYAAFTILHYRHFFLSPPSRHS